MLMRFLQSHPDIRRLHLGVLKEGPSLHAVRQPAPKIAERLQRVLSLLETNATSLEELRLSCPVSLQQLADALQRNGKIPGTQLRSLRICTPASLESPSWEDPSVDLAGWDRNVDLEFDNPNHMYALPVGGALSEASARTFFSAVVSHPTLVQLSYDVDMEPADYKPGVVLSSLGARSRLQVLSLQYFPLGGVLKDRYLFSTLSKFLEASSRGPLRYLDLSFSRCSTTHIDRFLDLLNKCPWIQHVRFFGGNTKVGKAVLDFALHWDHRLLSVDLDWVAMYQTYGAPGSSSNRQPTAGSAPAVDEIAEYCQPLIAQMDAKSDLMSLELASRVLDRMGDLPEPLFCLLSTALEIVQLHIQWQYRQQGCVGGS